MQMPLNPAAVAAALRGRTIAAALAVAAVVLLAPPPTGAGAQEPPPPRPQNPSPMVEQTRAHERIPETELPGTRFTVDDVLPRVVRVFVPDGVVPSPETSLLIHFHGAAFIPEHAAATADHDYIAATVNAGAGTAAYERLFADPATFDSLLLAIRRAVQAAEPSGRAGATRDAGGAHGISSTDSAGAAGDAPFGRGVVSAFSAGHGAVRALSRVPAHLERIDGALLLDGIHAAYIPPATVLAEGGVLDTTNITPWLPLLHAAMDGRKAVLITHSEIFPGTFASTTETTNWLLTRVGLGREPVLEWGPVGMQQLSHAGAGRLLVMGFAGNSAPDHIDHLHGMSRFLARLDALRQALPISGSAATRRACRAPRS
jgi:hypothetical protein